MPKQKIELTSPRGPNLGAKEEAEPISPPTAFRITTFSSPAGGGGPILSKVYYLTKRNNNQTHHRKKSDDCENCGQPHIAYLERIFQFSVFIINTVIDIVTVIIIANIFCTPHHTTPHHPSTRASDPLPWGHWYTWHCGSWLELCQGYFSL